VLTAALADRAAAHGSVDDWDAVERLLVLREVGADQQRGTFISRLPAAGLFLLFRKQADHEKEYRFDREPDGSPASGWSWTDLD